MKFRVAAVSDGKEMYQEEYARAELLVFRRSGCLNSFLWLPRFHVIATSGPNKCESYWHHRAPSSVYNTNGFVYQIVIYARVNR